LIFTGLKVGVLAVSEGHGLKLFGSKCPERLFEPQRQVGETKRKFHNMEVNDFISHIVHANDINRNMFIWNYLCICCRTCR